MRGFRTTLFALACAESGCPDPARGDEELESRSVRARSDTELLGELIFFDTDLSANRNQSCATCHGDEVGGTGPDEELNRAGAVYAGSVEHRFGNRKPPSTGYATLAPVLDLDLEGEDVRGGNFWDGRATGWMLGSAAADQAQGPPLNALEQALPSGDEMVRRICASTYGATFRSVYGEVACVDLVLGFDQAARAIAAYEDSSEVTAFSSRYDAYLAGEATLTAQEATGLALFEGKAGCAACHPSRPGPDGAPPAFTDFTYDNLGAPANPENPFYTMDTVLIDGEPINPLGRAWIDPGLGGFLDMLRTTDTWRSQPFVPERFTRLTTDDLARLADENVGKQRVPTLRNVDKRPRPDFVKAYSHNGWFKSLKSVVHFYSTRDVLPACASQVTAEEAMAGGCWPPPEVSETVNREEIGALGLTDEEEDAIVAFLGALTDGWTP